MKYTIEMNEEQTRIVKTALEEYFRIRMGQWEDLAEDLAMDGVDLSPENPRHEAIFEKFLTERNCIREILYSVTRIMNSDTINGRQKTQDMLIAEDVWEVIRHEMWKNLPDDRRNDWSVDSKEPFGWSGLPLPKISSEE